MKNYHVETQQDYDALMSKLEEKGYEWLSGYKPTEYNYWEENKEDSCINILDKGIGITNIERFKNQYPNIPVIEYKAKGEKMTEEEKKHNLQKIAFDVSVAVESVARDMSEVESDLQEAKSSAKKLIEKIDEYLESQKPKFKVGDYVTVYINDRTIIAKIDKLWEHTAEAHGLWYDQTKVNVKQDFWFISKVSKCRYATSEEIAEYESALNFHKHGRKPFEVKDGDLLDNVFGKYIAHEHSFSKEDFTVGGNTLLKTAEEFNEWLENK